MGIYDRDYYQREEGGFSLRAPQSVIGRLILLNLALWIADALLFSETHQLGYWLAAKPDTLFKPWLWWQFLSYGFMHSVQPEHIILNMLTLWIFGNEVEPALGRKEFLRLYLVLLAVGGIAWAASAQLSGVSRQTPLVGASAAVVGTVVLFVFQNPHRTILFFFVLPMPAWLLGVMLVGYDAYGAMVRDPGNHVANVAHLAGAAFAAIYFRRHWNLGSVFTVPAWLVNWRRPHLKIHVPKDEPDPDVPVDVLDDDLGRQVDEILEKIHRQGEASLTRKERRILEAASRQYQRRRENSK
jgi:membrane associated rhomboid family serine protease